MHLPFLLDFFDVFTFFFLGISNLCNSINIPLQLRRYFLSSGFSINQVFPHNPRLPVMAFCFLFQCHCRTYILSQNVCNKNKTIFFIKRLWNDMHLMNMYNNIYKNLEFSMHYQQILPLFSSIVINDKYFHLNSNFKNIIL